MRLVQYVRCGMDQIVDRADWLYASAVPLSHVNEAQHRADCRSVFAAFPSVLGPIQM